MLSCGSVFQLECQFGKMFASYALPCEVARVTSLWVTSDRFLGENKLVKLRTAKRRFIPCAILVLVLPTPGVRFYADWACQTHFQGKALLSGCRRLRECLVPS